MSDYESNPRPIVRVPVNNRKADQLRAAHRDMLAGYPYLGSLASSDSVPYHAVRTDQFRWLGTDGVAVLLNDTPDGFFSDPGWVPVPEDAPKSAITTLLNPGQPVAPNPNSNRQPMDDDERIFGVSHEILHIAREDAYWNYTYELQGYVPVPKSQDAPDGRFPYDRESFELTADAQINSALIADRVGKAPKGAYTNPKVNYSMPFGDAYAIVHAERMKNPPPPPGPGNGPDGGGGTPPLGPSKHNQGGGDLLKPGQAGDPFGESTDPNDPGNQPSSPAEAAQRIAEGRAEREAMHQRAQEVARQMGSGSCAVEVMVTKARVPHVDWRDYVWGFFSRAGGVSAWDWKRPQKIPLLRADHPYFAPARGGHGVGHIVLVMDTSGSVGIPETRVFLGSAADMLESLKPRELTIIFCDSDIQRVDAADVSDSFESYDVPKGGGTSFIPPFDYVAEHFTGEDKPDALIYLTDLYGRAPEQEPPYPVLWLSVSDRTEPVSGGRWGETVKVPVSDLQED